MVSSPPSNPGALVIDANITIALASKEGGRATTALAEMAHYAQIGYMWFAPGVIIAETLYMPNQAARNAPTVTIQVLTI